MLLLIILLVYIWICVDCNENVTICSLVAATNIESLYSEWSCTSGGVPKTSPCANNWNGLVCSNGFVTSLVWREYKLSGNQIEYVEIFSLTF